LEAEKEIANFITGGAADRQQKAKMLFAGLLATPIRSAASHERPRGRVKQERIAERALARNP
jgi:hypothetical protein